MAASSLTLRGWQWRKPSEEAWTQPTSRKSVTQIHVDLMEAGVIADPLIGLNERDVQWVGDVDWEYRTIFHQDDAARSSKHKDLVFEGLDVYATVFLNNHKILKSDNMFHIHRVPVSRYLKEGENELRILFEACFQKGKDLEAEHGLMDGWNGDRSRLYVRKAQYHYGWDSCPKLLTCGPYRPVKFECYSSLIDDCYVHVEVNEALEADISVQLTILAPEPALRLKVELLSPSGQCIEAWTNILPQEDAVKFHLSKPELWWPHKYGKQPLYSIHASLISASGDMVHDVMRSFGIRRVKLVQSQLLDEPGSSFFFEINNHPIFVSGSNWAPAHIFHTTLDKGYYDDRLQMVVDGEQDMLRVWGGGIYEEDLFYSTCDEKGILLFHDFMFACGAYPAYPEFLKSVEKEVVDQLKRLRNFASIVHWAGNNEDYQVAETHQGYSQAKRNSRQWSKFPATAIYEEILPRMVQKYHIGTGYQPSSPWGGDLTSDTGVGDMHQWNVWHILQLPYQRWPELLPRFMSEFGLQAYPDAESMNAFIIDESHRHIQSETMDHHNKADASDRRLAFYVMENVVPRSMSMSDWAYASQLVQADCLSLAYRSARRRFSGSGKEYCGGLLCWQTLDCWPCTSWSVIDFYGRAKLGYYAVKRESSPQVVAVHRREKDGKADMALPPRGPVISPPHDYSTRHYQIDIWASNGSTTATDLTLEISFYEVETGERLKTTRQNVHIPSTYSTDLVTGMHIPAQSCSVVEVRLVSETGNVLARSADWPQPLKHLHLPKAEVKVTVCVGKAKVTTNKPVKCLQLSLKGRSENLKWEDNGFDLFPDDERIILCPGLKEEDEVEVRWYEG